MAHYHLETNDDGSIRRILRDGEPRKLLSFLLACRLHAHRKDIFRPCAWRANGLFS